MVDPAADIAAFLIETAGSFKYEPGPPPEPAAIEQLALMHLETAFSPEAAERILHDGIPSRVPVDGYAAVASQADVAILTSPVTREKLLHYLGRRTIRKRGCFACHDIPGFAAAAPIGPALSEFGSKDVSLLAFHGVGTQRSRSAFVERKLHRPRGFDRNVASERPFNKWLLMGRFRLTPGQREAATTFVLGLTGWETPADYVYAPDNRERAIIDGRRVLDKYACRQCHTTRMEQWRIALKPGRIEPPIDIPQFEFMKTPVDPEAVERSLRTDYRGRRHATLVGRPQVNEDGEPAVVDDDIDAQGNEILMRAFELWEPAVIDGQRYEVGAGGVLVWENQIAHRRPAQGGQFARMLLPTVLADARAAGSAAMLREAWGWLPPSLVDEGAKVQASWLHQYLLDPTPIRPAAVLRMPRYNMSSAEATQLARYFRAVLPSPLGRGAGGEGRKVVRERRVESNRLDQAMRVLIDRQTFCAKCHYIGAYGPGGATRTTLAPDLENVAHRLHPSYIRQWVARPNSILPYTGMPVNFPPEGEPLGQDLLPGTSREQLEAVTELLAHFDEYLKAKVDPRSLVPASGER